MVNLVPAAQAVKLQPRSRPRKHQELNNHRYARPNSKPSAWRTADWPWLIDNRVTTNSNAALIYRCKLELGSIIRTVKTNRVEMYYIFVCKILDLFFIYKQFLYKNNLLLYFLQDLLNKLKYNYVG